MPDFGANHTYWQGLARSYAALGPPLRPCDADIAAMEGAVAEWAARHPGRPMRALLLGVTPQIAAMRWPGGTSLIAADQSVPMVRMVWPGNISGRRAASCAEWRRLPLRDACCDVVIGDGSLSCVRYPEGLRAVAAEARRVLCNDGILVVRCYVQAERPERPEEVMADLFRGSIPSFHWFKFRLLMALQEDAEAGIAVDAVYRFWAGQRVDEVALAAQTGWDLEAIRMMSLYRGTNTVHTFPTAAETHALISEFFGDVEFGEGRCPLSIATTLGAVACAR